MITGPTTPTAGPDTAGNIYRLTDALRVEVHRPADDDGEWVDAGGNVTPRDNAHALEIRAIVDDLYREKALWVHDLGSPKRGGLVFGWPSDESPTGWWTGHIIRVDSAALRVLVGNILPGDIRPVHMVHPHQFQPH